jgi:hypothetical protein
MDRWILATQAQRLRRAADPLVIDLGFGASPVTTLELAARLAPVRADLRVLGLEIDADRVAAASVVAAPPGLDFARGGFELAGRRPVLVRAANVLRQYPEPAAAEAWRVLRAGLAPDGVIVEGTCDEIGRLGTWVLLDGAGPVSLTLAAHVASLARPSQLAERLPKALIHHNVDGQPIHQLLRCFDRAWDASATLSPFGPRQRWVAACGRVAEEWPVIGGRTRWRLGELTVDWPAVAPA